MFKNIVSTATGVALGLYFIQPIVSVALIAGVIWLVVNRKKLADAFQAVSKRS